MSFRRKDGQIFFLTALMATTLVIMFGMVVAVGHMVQARINLQNAADFAAMAGASVQARYLNKMALVNYRARQNYKWTLFDLYVTQSRFNTGLRNLVAGFGGNPFARTADPELNMSFGICQQSRGFTRELDAGDSFFIGQGDPGRSVDTQTDLCKQVVDNGGIPDIVTVTPISLDPTVIALANLTVTIRNEFIADCQAAGRQNLYYFNDYAMPSLVARQEVQRVEFEDTLAQFQEAFSTQPTLDAGKIGDGVVIQTVKDNLIGAFDPGSLDVVYLNQANNRVFQGSVGTSFDRLLSSFAFIAIEWQFGAGCIPVPQLLTRNGIFAGYAPKRINGADPLNELNMTVQVSANPDLLFWPRGMVPTLSAIGSAKPFGSRLGPDIELFNQEVTGQRTTGTVNGAVANMRFYPNDFHTSGGQMGGIGHLAVISAAFGATDFPLDNGRSELRPKPTAPDFSTQICRAGVARPFHCFVNGVTLYEGLMWNAFLETSQLPTPLQAFANLNVNDEFFQLTVADPPAYELEDRGLSDFQPNFDRFHRTVINGDIVSAGQPVIYATEETVASSWSPDLDPSRITSHQDIRGGRMGYQIKLQSIEDACATRALGASELCGVEDGATH